MFDGVHEGHRFVLRQVVACAQQRGLQSMAITFDHTLRHDDVLTPLDEKLLLLSRTHIDKVEVLPFTAELKQMTARQFMEQVLKDRLGVKVLLTGYDNRFGHNREEGFDDYVRYGQELGIEVRQLRAEGAISSSLIRQLIADGNIGKANELLGHPYALPGRVEHGEHIGTQMGFPTANIVADDQRQLIPASGAYAVKVSIGDDTTWKAGMMNIGTRPTFDGSHQTLEVNIFDFDEDLYGKSLRVEFVSRLREERRFDSMEALREQLRKDEIQAKKVIL
jgi:riboflavin kinase/FMN adenylyltransferase